MKNAKRTRSFMKGRSGHMRDYEYLFVTTLHQKLKDKIVGKIFTKVNTNDELYVEIISFGDLMFKTTLGNFSEKIMNGWSTDYAAYEVIGQYKTFINERFFK